MSEESPFADILLPERPGLGWFVIGMALLVLPWPFVFSGPALFVPMLIGSVTLGAGLGISWVVLCLRDWLRRVPFNGLAVIAIHLATLANLELVPRLETSLRAQQAGLDASAWWRSPADPLPSYRVGEGSEHFVRAVAPGPEADAVVAYTPVALRRWTPFGMRDGCWVIVRRNGSPGVVPVKPGEPRPNW